MHSVNPVTPDYNKIVLSNTALKAAALFTQEYNFEFMECSAATGENVIECLETMAR